MPPAEYEKLIVHIIVSCPGEGADFPLRTASRSRIRVRHHLIERVRVRKLRPGQGRKGSPPCWLRRRVARHDPELRRIASERDIWRSIRRRLYHLKRSSASGRPGIPGERER